MIASLTQRKVTGVSVVTVYLRGLRNATGARLLATAFRQLHAPVIGDELELAVHEVEVPVVTGALRQ